MSKNMGSMSMNLGMGTMMTHRVFGKYVEESLSAVHSEAVRLEKLLSRFIHESEISRINRSTKSWFFALMLRCLSLPRMFSMYMQKILL